MTAMARLCLGGSVVGLFGLLALAVYSGRTESPPAAAIAAALPPPCSSCDARHARLSDVGIGALEAQE